MQHSSLEIKEKLLRALDNEYNVLDMDTVSEVISTLEKEHVTKETLEKTRIGKYINELRKKTNDKLLAKRAKGLVRNWRKLLPDTLNGERVGNSLNVTVLTPSLGNRTPKSCELVTPSQHIKNQSPSVLLDFSASPFCSSASNSPHFSFIELQGKSRSLLPSSYAPVSKVNTQPCTSNENVNRIETKMTQSKTQAASNYLFKPVSPAYRSMQNSNSRTNVTENLPHPKPQSSNCASNSVSNISAMLNAVESPGGSQRIENSISPPHLTPTCSGSSDCSLEGIKKYAANKRRMKDSKSSPNSKRQKLDKFPSETNLLNGTDSALETARKLNNATSPLKKESVMKVKKRASVMSKSPDLKEKLSSLSAGSKLPKVKTTQQLIDELKAKKDTLYFPVENACDLQPEKESKSGQVNSSGRTLGLPKLKSELPESAKQSDSAKHEIKAECSNSLKVNSCSNDSHGSSPHDRVLSPSSDTVPSNISVISQDKDINVPFKDPVTEEIEQIMKSWPSIDYEAAFAEEEPLPEREVLTEEEANEKYKGEWDHVNGVYAPDGSFRYWHECTFAYMSDEQVLKILPFINLD